MAVIVSGDILGFEQFVALRVDDLALVVGDVVVFEQLLADVEVAAFDLALGGFERTRTSGCSIASPSGIFRRSMIAFRRSPAKMRRSGSSSDR